MSAALIDLAAHSTLNFKHHCSHPPGQHKQVNSSKGVLNSCSLSSSHLNSSPSEPECVSAGRVSREYTGLSLVTGVSSSVK